MKPSISSLIVPLALMAMDTSGVEARTGNIMTVMGSRPYEYHRRWPMHEDLQVMLQEFMTDGRVQTRRMQQEAQRAAVVEPRHFVTHHDQHLELVLEVPGVGPEDVNIQLDATDRVLHITGRRHQTGRDLEFDQSFQLHKDVDENALEVTLSHGLLRVIAPKKERVIRQIPIQTTFGAASLTAEKEVEKAVDDKNANTEDETVIDIDTE